MAEELSFETFDNQCIFIDSSLLDQPENLEDWLSKTGHYLISNDSINNGFVTQQLDPLLGETNVELSDDDDSVQLKKAASKNILKKPKPIVTDKLIDIERKFKNGMNVFFSQCDNKIVLQFCDLDDRKVMQECQSSLSELFGTIIKEKDKQCIVEFNKIEVNNGVNITIPCLLSEMGVQVFICPQNGCNQVFAKLGTVKFHAVTHFGYKPYQCAYPNCTWAFHTLCKLKRHQATHEKKKDFICPIDGCLRRFTTIYNLKNHKRVHDRPAELPCPVNGCEEMFRSTRDRERHLRSHDRSEAPFHCPFQNCNRQFFLDTALSVHTRTHQHKETKLQCSWPDCGKLFELPCRLKEHSRTHTGQRPYSCTYEDCKWSFSTAGKLRRHEIIHTNERKFHCTIENCNKSFLRSEHLKEHTVRHALTRSYKCEICAAKFLSKARLYVHLNKNHKTEACARAIPYQNQEKSNQDILLEQAIQSLGVPSDMILVSDFLPEEPLELLDTEDFSTVNLD